MIISPGLGCHIALPLCKQSLVSMPAAYRVKKYQSYKPLYKSRKSINPISHGIFFPWLPGGGGERDRFCPPLWEAGTGQF